MTLPTFWNVSDANLEYHPKDLIRIVALSAGLIDGNRYARSGCAAREEDNRSSGSRPGLGHSAGVLRPILFRGHLDDSPEIGNVRRTY